MRARPVALIVFLLAFLTEDVKAWQQCPDDPSLLFDRPPSGKLHLKLFQKDYDLIPIGDSKNFNLGASFKHISDRLPHEYSKKVDVNCQFSFKRNYEPIVNCKDKAGRVVEWTKGAGVWGFPRFKTISKEILSYEWGGRFISEQDTHITCLPNSAVLIRDFMGELYAKKDGQRVNTNNLLFVRSYYFLDVKKREAFSGFRRE